MITSLGVRGSDDIVLRAGDESGITVHVEYGSMVDEGSEADGECSGSTYGTRVLREHYVDDTIATSGAPAARYHSVEGA